MKPKFTIRGSDEKTVDELDQLVQASVEQSEDTAALTSRIASRVLETEKIASGSYMQISNQGEQINTLNTKLDILADNVKVAQRDANYLKKLTGSFLIPVLAPSIPRGIQKSVMKGLQFAAAAPKDSGGNPIATARTSSLTAKPLTQPGVELRPSGGVVTLDGASEEQIERSRAAELQIEENMGIVSRGMGNLREAASSMGSELDRQSHVVDTILEKADSNATNVANLNRKVRSMLKKKK